MQVSYTTRAGVTATALAVILLVSACGGGGQASTAQSSEASASEAASAEASTQASSGPTGPAALDAPAEIQAGTQFEVAWTGPNAQGDYVTIVAAGALKWTNEPYFYTTSGTPSKLVAPVADGAYALWYVSGADDAILARRAIRVTPFEGALLGPAEVMAGSTFEVAWNGPNGPGDYVTVVAAGATKWTDESYFYTNAGSPGKLTADLKAGSYELWYVTGNATTPQDRSPITVTPYVVTLDAQSTVSAGAQFPVNWTGPNGPSDYITIVPVGAPDIDYGSYAYTTAGSPVTITAPTTKGNYEIRYASDRVDIVFGRRAITVN